MHNVITPRNLSLVAAAFLLTAASFATTAVFSASQPGGDLAPVGDAGQFVQILQGNRTLLWTSLTGTVMEHTVRGWPSQTGDAELGGGLVIERPEDGSVGVIDFGEKPMSVSFTLNG